MRYDAFISYRHGGLDGQVAERLHRMLETFRIPAAITRKTGKKRIGRVFRDREELPTSSDLSNSIENALQESEFLVLVCSKRTCQSRWVLREVDRFIELGRRDRIITLLIDGEPDEAFPEQLRWRETPDGGREELEPLAADIRAETPEKSLKLLKTELLRVLAPMLGCAYDDLKQRHRERAMRRLLAGVSAGLAVALAFAAVTFTQLVRVNEQMRMKLYNQSFVLAEYSTAALNEGDPVTAALLALEGLPKDPANPERPYVAAAEVALAKAIGAYDYRETFVPHRSLAFPAKSSSVVLAPDEEHLAVLLQDNTLALVRTEDGAIVQTFDTVSGAGRGAVFTAPDVLIYTGAAGLTAVSIPTGEILWQAEKAHGLAVSADASTIAAACDAGIVLFDANGAEKGRLDVQGRSFHGAQDVLPGRYNCLELNEDGSLLAVAFTDGSFSVFDTRSGAETRLLTDAAFVTCRFTPGYLACAWLPLAKDDISMDALGGDYRMAAFDGKTLARAWEQESYGPARAVAHGDSVAFTTGRRLAVFAPGGWSETRLAVFPEGPVAVAEKYGLILAGYLDGRFAFQAASSGAGHPAWPEGLENAEYKAPRACDKLALGRRFAVAASTLSETALILRWNGKNAAVTYACPDVSIARGNAAGTRLYVRDFTAYRVLDAESGEAVLTLPFADDDEMWNMNYSEVPASGNILGSYKGRCSLYSAVDGALLFQGGGKGCTLTDAGLNVRTDTELLLVDPGSGREKARHALPAGGMLVFEKWVISSEGQGFSVSRAGEKDSRQYPDAVFKAARPMGGDLLILATAEGTIRCLSARDGTEFFRLKEPVGRYAAHFPEDLDLLFVVSFTAPPAAYALPDGKPLPVLVPGNHSFLNAVVIPDSGYLLTLYATEQGSDIGLLQRADSFEVIAEIPSCMGSLGANFLLLGNSRSLKAVPRLSSAEIRAMAERFTAGRSLTLEQRKRYHVME